MSISAWPFENADTTEVQYSKLVRQLQDNGIINGLVVTPGTGMQVNISSGDGLVQGFYFESTATEPRTASNSDATQVRRDYVILKLDLAANTITLEIKAGTANGSTGTLPALTQNATVFEYPFAVLTIRAGASTIVSGDISNQQVGPGMRVVSYPNQSSRPVAPSQRQLGLNLSTKTFDYWDGAAWTSLAPAAPAWGDITGVPATFPPSAHTHDDRYFTEAESNTNFAAKSHTHTASQISDPQNLSVGDSDKVNGQTIFVQSATPTAKAVNDLWFW